MLTNANKDGPPGLLSGLRVLVAEDVDPNRDLIEIFLRQEGASVESCDDGHAAATLAVTQVFDVILMDLHMPILDGLEATRLIRESGSHSASTPIIGLTANVMADQIAECHRAGMNGHIAKPFSKEGLASSVLKAVRG